MMNQRLWRARFFFTFLLPLQPAAAEKPSITVGEFQQELRLEFTTADGLPGGAITGVTFSRDGTAFAGTENGLFRWDGARWAIVPATTGAAVDTVTTGSNGVLFISRRQLFSWQGETLQLLAELPDGAKANSISAGHRTHVATDRGLFELMDHTLSLVTALDAALGGNKTVHQLAEGPHLVAGAAAGLFMRQANGAWTRLFPADTKSRSWAPVEVRGTVYDSAGRLWFASPQGAGRLDAGGWTLFTGADGLPCSDFTTMAAGEEGVVWFGTKMGALRHDGQNWEYRQGRRWLPHDHVHAISVSSAGDAWLATAGGLSVIKRQTMTLQEKAAFYESQIDALHRRTPWGYVLAVRALRAGATNEITRHDSDNDGLWTSMYGAGECFAYGATRDPLARKRAHQAFEALRWLGEVTQGGSHSPPPGYVARTILPVNGPDPNAGRIERDKAQKAHGDSLWKVYEPRWPKSKDGQWYWKSDTSSDELDGHFFFYPLYYDLVCESGPEKSRVREHVRALIDHIVNHDFNLIDHDGTPTRWSVYNPAALNHDPMWSEERGLKSLSLLSYLAASEHVTGDTKYRRIMDMLRQQHAYDTNLKVPKIQRGVGSGNHSDDEMAFMCFYNLMKYGRDPALLAEAGYAFYCYWILEFPEMNPFFNFAYAAFGLGRTYTNPWGTHDISPWPGWLDDSVETLKRFPLDRFDWRHTNSRRLDIVTLPRQAADPYDAQPERRGFRVNGKVIPVDERHFNHWNHDPFVLDAGSSGNGLADGAVFLLPYYMGLYHGFISEAK